MYSEYYETYPNLNNTTYSNNYTYTNANDNDRGFFVPFVLGGITGGLLAPAFYRPYPYYYNQYPYNPYPYYGYYRK